MTVDTKDWPDGARTCPACDGTGDGPEYKYQPVEGMSYMDVPSCCSHCDTVGSRWSGTFRPTGYVMEERWEQVCDEVGACYSCGSVEWIERDPKQTLCPDCIRDEYDDHLFHRDR